MNSPHNYFVAILFIIILLNLTSKTSQSNQKAIFQRDWKNEVAHHQDTTIINIKGGQYCSIDLPETSLEGSIVLFPVSDSVALFGFNGNLIEPSYASGGLFGKIVLQDESWNYCSVEGFESPNCLCEFLFKNDTLVVVSNSSSSDCELGNGVFIQNTYILKSDKTQDHFMLGFDTIYFKDYVDLE